MSNFVGGPDVQGIYQTDVILQTAILAGLKELKAKPWLLQYVWPNLASDPLTKDIYGQAEIDQAVKWVLNTNIPVFLNTRIDDFRGTCISIAMASSSEDNNTLSDTHYVPFVSTFTPNEMLNLSAPFSPTAYDQDTGTVTLPQATADSVNFFVGGYLVNQVGTAFLITQTLSETQLVVQPAPQANLDLVTFQAPPNSWTIQMQSAWMKETYHIGCHVDTINTHLLYLHSIVLFILFRNRKTLLEGRGIELTKLDSQDFGRDEGLSGEWIYRRYIELEGKVRHFWPVGDPIPVILDGITQYKEIGTANVPVGIDPNTQFIIGEEDQYITLGGPVLSSATEPFPASGTNFPPDPGAPNEAAQPITLPQKS